MHPQQQREVVFLLTIIAVSAGFGALIHQTLLFISLAVLTYTIFTLRNLFKLHDWLISRKKQLPDAQGYWGEIFNELHLLEKEKLESRERLTQALTRFQDAAEALPDAAVILSPRNEIEWSNDMAWSLLGISYPKDAGQKINNLIRNPAFQKYLLSNKFSENITLPSPENLDHTLSLQIVPFGSRQKLILCRDITHVIKLEEMRSNFVSNVSHEMRSPLTVLTGYLEMFKDMAFAKQDATKTAVENMYNQAKRMENLVKDLLALARLETNPVEHRNMVDVPALLTSLKENAEILGQEKQHTITLHSEPGLQLRGNSEELHSLFSNLINNAVRYTPANGKIAISWQTDEQGGAVFSVSDNGPGIARQHIPHLTERFYRVDIDRSRETGGTGLGLAIVKHAIERHEGKLEIDSQLGKGSTFRVRFPQRRLQKLAAA